MSKSPKPSFADRLNQLKETGGGPGIREMINQQHEALEFKEEFFGAVAELDALRLHNAIQFFGKPYATAIRELAEGNWSSQMAHAETLAKGIPAAEQAISTIKLFSENPLLGGLLGKVMDEIARPFQAVFSPTQFNTQLTNLEINGLAEVSTEPPGRKSFQWDGRWYYPPAGKRVAQLGWPSIVRALGRVRSYQKTEGRVAEQIKTLVEKATMESDPEKQFLHKLLLTGVVGSLVIWDSKSYIIENDENKNIGLIGILIRRTNRDEGFAVEGWVADRPLQIPNGTTYALPHLRVHQRADGFLETGFTFDGKLDAPEFKSVMRIQHLIWAWLKQEGKFRIQALPAYSDPAEKLPQQEVGETQPQEAPQAPPANEKKKPRRQRKAQ